MFGTFFLASMILLKKYRKMFSIYSYLIIVVMNVGLIYRAIVYNVSQTKYAQVRFKIDVDDHKD
jgi:hypothetical protein